MEFGDCSCCVDSLLEWKFGDLGVRFGDFSVSSSEMASKDGDSSLLLVDCWFSII